MPKYVTIPTVGDTINGNYTLHAVIGEGAFGKVYEATQLGLERKVALKILHPRIATHGKLIERFKREAHIASTLRHPNSVLIVEFGVYGEGEDTVGLPFIAMEFLDGEDLSSYLEGRERVELPEAVSILEQTAGSLSEAHLKGIIHRDLKPQNLFICPQPDRDLPFVKVLDFGIAKMINDAWGSEVAASLTKTGAICGTPAYMAPEQAAGERNLTAAADIYSLGCIGFEMLAGHAPYTATNPMTVALKHMTDPVPPLPPPYTGTWIEELIRTCLAKAPEERFPDASSLLEILRQHAGDPASRSSSGSQSMLERVRARTQKSRSDTRIGEADDVEYRSTVSLDSIDESEADERPSIEDDGEEPTVGLDANMLAQARSPLSPRTQDTSGPIEDFGSLPAAIGDVDEPTLGLDQAKVDAISEMMRGHREDQEEPTLGLASGDLFANIGFQLDDDDEEDDPTGETDILDDSFDEEEAEATIDMKVDRDAIRARIAAKAAEKLAREGAGDPDDEVEPTVALSVSQDELQARLDAMRQDNSPQPGASSKSTAPVADEPDEDEIEPTMALDVDQDELQARVDALSQGSAATTPADDDEVEPTVALSVDQNELQARLDEMRAQQAAHDEDDDEEPTIGVGFEVTAAATAMADELGEEEPTMALNVDQDDLESRLAEIRGQTSVHGEEDDEEPTMMADAPSASDDLFAMAGPEAEEATRAPLSPLAVAQDELERATTAEYDRDEDRPKPSGFAPTMPMEPVSADLNLGDMPRPKADLPQPKPPTPVALPRSVGPAVEKRAQQTQELPESEIPSAPAAEDDASDPDFRSPEGANRMLDGTPTFIYDGPPIDSLVSPDKKPPTPATVRLTEPARAPKKKSRKTTFVILIAIFFFLMGGLIAVAIAGYYATMIE